MLMHKMLFVMVFVMVLILYAFTTNVALAQLSADNPSEKKALSNIGLSSPLIQKISDKGIYNVTIKSGQSSIPSGLNFEIVFLNASSPNLDATPPGS